MAGHFTLKIGVTLAFVLGPAVDKRLTDNI